MNYQRDPEIYKNLESTNISQIVIKLPNRKSLCLNRHTAKFGKIFMEHTMPILSKHINEMRREPNATKVIPRRNMNQLVLTRERDSMQDIQIYKYL